MNLKQIGKAKCVRADMKEQENGYLTDWHEVLGW